MKIIFALFTLVYISKVSATQVTKNLETITLRADIWCPYNCDPQSDKPGIMIEFAKAAFEPLGYKVDYQTMGYTRVLKEVAEGRYVGVIGASRSDVNGFVLPRMPLGQMKMHFFALKDSTWFYKDSHTLKGKTIAVVGGYTYENPIIDEMIAQKSPTFKIVQGDDALPKIFKMLEAKRVDAFIENTVVVNHNLVATNRPIQSFKIISERVNKDTDLFIAFSPKNPNSKLYAEILSNGMDRLKQTGEFQKILNKYSVQEWSW